MDYSKQHFEQMYKSNYRQMYRLAYCLVEDAEEARDAVSQVFAQLWQRKPDVQEQALSGYLLAATRNQCLHTLRRRSQQQELAEAWLHEPEPTTDEAHEELMAELTQAIANHLTPQDRKVLELHFGEEMTYKETAQMLGISASAVNKHVSAALAKLRRILA